MTDFFARHAETLNQALAAVDRLGYWSPYPEVPSGKIYGADAAEAGKAAFEARRGRPFELDLPGIRGTIAADDDPYGTELGITYPDVDPDALIPAMESARRAWAAASPAVRAGVCLEILDRLNKRSFEIAHAVMHTTGQAFVMAFQAGGPHAQDRGLEAVAHGYREQNRVPAESVIWEKPAKPEPIRLTKTYRIAPRGIGLVIGCSTFPTWNGYPGLFASLVTGNAVIMKPHHGSVLPQAITVAIGREVLREAGFDPDVLALVVDRADAPVAKDLALRPEVRIIDYTGGSGFGTWLEENARQAAVFTEKAGVNSIILDSCDDLRAVTGNIAFSLSLYSGQMCTTPQNILVPRDGITAGGEKISFEEVCAAIATAVEKFLDKPERAFGVLGAIKTADTGARIDAAAADGKVLLASKTLDHPEFPGARVRTPLILRADASETDLYMKEWFGPIAFVIACDDTDQAIALAAGAARDHGAITSAIWSTDPARVDQAFDAMTGAGVALSANLPAAVLVNQSAAFSDFHVSGANPAGNASLVDPAFIARRFHVVYKREPA